MGFHRHGLAQLACTHSLLSYPAYAQPGRPRVLPSSVQLSASASAPALSCSRLPYQLHAPAALRAAVVHHRSDAIAPGHCTSDVSASVAQPPASPPLRAMPRSTRAASAPGVPPGATSRTRRRFVCRVAPAAPRSPSICAPLYLPRPAAPRAPGTTALTPLRCHHRHWEGH